MQALERALAAVQVLVSAAGFEVQEYLSWFCFTTNATKVEGNPAKCISLSGDIGHSMTNPDNDAQTLTPLLSALQDCARRPHAAFYTPGHKRGVGASPALTDWWGSQVFAADLPELPELDNLFAPAGVIQAAQDLAAAAFGAEKTWFLVNGSTCGVIAAILATCNPGDYILLPRNIHQSAIAGLIYAGAIPLFLEPGYDPVLDLVYSLTPAAVAAALAEYPQIKAVLIVSPTYQGICGDVAAIAEITHGHGIPLLVDAAHGPHFNFHPDLPVSALAAGADLVVQSTHKVLSALTQAAMLHLQGSYIPAPRIRQALQLCQSTSPNYLLLASLDAARQQLATQGQPLLEQTLKLADQARGQINQIPGLSTLNPEQADSSSGFVALDRTRLTVDVSRLGLSGFRADEILHRTLGVTAEFPTLRHLTFILSLGNTEKDILHLVEACQVLAQQYCQTGKLLTSPALVQPPLAPPERSPREAFFSGTETVSIHQAIERVSAELICPYPPGIPVLLPGERITPAAIEFLQQVSRVGGRISGCSDLSLQTLKVVRD